MKPFLNTTRKTRLLGQLTLSVAAGALVSGYGRAVYAGDCIAQGGGTYTCAGPAQQNADSQQVFEAGVDLQITTEEGFGLDVSRINLGQGFNIDNATSVEIDGTASGEIISDGTAIDLFRTQGNTDIDTTGLEITSANGDGIEAGGFRGNGNVDITTGRLDVDADGIDLDHEVFGDVTINTAGGDVTSVGADGIDVVKSGGGAVDITTGNIDVQTEGVELDAEGAFGVDIDTTGGSVSTRSGEGVVVDAYASGDITVETADVTSEEDGVELISERNGNVFIDTTDGVVESRSSYGVFVDSQNDLGVEVRTGEVNAAYEGVEVNADRTDFITIDTAGGAVTGGEDGVKLSAYNPINLFVRTQDVTGEDDGVYIDSSDGFDVRLDTLAGDIEGKGGTGIEVEIEDHNNTYFYIGDVTGGYRGIDLDLRTADRLDLNTTAGSITGEADDGLRVRLEDTGYAQVATSDVTGGTSGIDVYAENANDIIIATQGGAVTGQTEEGIVVESQYGQDIDITTADVAGETTGILVSSRYDDDIYVDSRGGTVIGLTDAGIEIDRSGTSEDVSVETADVRGATYGILVTSEDGFQITIDTTAGAVEGTANTGISAYAYDDGFLIDIDTGDVTGGETGVYAAGDGIDFFEVDTTGGNITGGTEVGVEVDANFADEIDVRTANVTGGETGVEVNAQLIGGQIDDVTDVNIDTSAGAVTGGRFGVLAYNDSVGQTEVTVGDVNGGEIGVVVETEGNTRIDVRGDVVGSVGIDATEVEDVLGTGSQLILSGSVTGTNGTAIAFGGGSDSLEIIGNGPAPLAAFSVLSGQQGIFGETRFGVGNDSLSFIGDGLDDPIFSGSFGSLFDGGADEDVAVFSTFVDDLLNASLIGDVLKLDFGNAAGSLASLQFSNFELFSFGEDANRFFAARDLVDLFGGGAGGGGGDIGAIPLPLSAWLLGSGLFGLGALRRRKLRQV